MEIIYNPEKYIAVEENRMGWGRVLQPWSKDVDLNIRLINS